MHCAISECVTEMLLRPGRGLGVCAVEAERHGPAADPCLRLRVCTSGAAPHGVVQRRAPAVCLSISCVASVCKVARNAFSEPRLHVPLKAQVHTVWCDLCVAVRHHRETPRLSEPSCCAGEATWLPTSVHVAAPNLLVQYACSTAHRSTAHRQSCRNWRACIRQEAGHA